MELEYAPVDVRAILARVPEENREYVKLSKESAELAQHYIAAGAVEERHLVDAQHIAIATVNRVDVLVSWNFRHVVNLQRMRRYNDATYPDGHDASCPNGYDASHPYPARRKTTCPSSTSTSIASPSRKSPSSTRSASGFSNSRWMARFSGRAP